MAMVVGNLTHGLTLAALLLGLTAVTGCTPGASGQTAPPPDAGAPAATTTSAMPTVVRPAPTLTTRPAVPPNIPVGFPVAPASRPLRVIETAQGKDVAAAPPGSPSVVDIARTYQPRPENDEEANRFGWNCRLHAKYEGAPAVDWYFPAKTPVVATMQGQAELYVITTVNAFQYYGVNPRLTLGLPHPSMPLFPLPGPGGGMGVFVSILNGDLRAEYGHVDLAATLAVVPSQAFLPPYSKTYAYDEAFSQPLQPWDGTLVARWPVERGDTLGGVGNSGYSDVPHLHYQIVTADRTTKYCPTTEEYPSSGWLFAQPGAPR